MSLNSTTYGSERNINDLEARYISCMNRPKRRIVEAQEFFFSSHYTIPVQCWVEYLGRVLNSIQGVRTLPDLQGYRIVVGTVCV